MIFKLIRKLLRRVHVDEITSQRDVSLDTIEAMQHEKFHDWFKAHVSPYFIYVVGTQLKPFTKQLLNLQIIKLENENGIDSINDDI